ncbi:MAG: NADH-quinone oxidoreductase subunit NuoG [Thiolinea sp.]
MSGGHHMHKEMITFEVNGVELSAPKGSMLIEATDAAGITVPRFCYHHKLSVAANCRMCLVEVEKAPKPVPACATPIASGMKVWTRSENARTAQEDIMSFLLINHPLDCPICDQGGECELQDISLGFGNSSSQFAEIKRVVRDKDIGPLIETEMTRCIHCTRCVRFGEEIAGLRELGATGRGEAMAIGTYVSKAVSSELSGNVIDLCPVGALTAKPSRYKARAWEMQAHESIAPHDSVGSNVSVHTFDGSVIRVVPDTNEAINECWLSDRDRFSYQALQSRDRILKPQIKRDGEWFEVSWQQALDAAREILQQTEPGQLGGLASPCSTLEELYLFQKLLRGAGCRHIDHRLRQVDFSDQDQVSTAPVLGVSISELEQQQAVLLIGSNCRQEQPLLNHRLRKAVAAGGRVIVLNPRAVDFNFDVTQKVVKPLDMSMAMAAIACALSELTGKALPEEVADFCQQAEVTDSDRDMAACLLSAEHSMVLLGNMAIQHPQLAVIRALSGVISGLTDSVCGYFQEAANTVGASLAGVLPHRQPAGERTENAGLNVREMLETSLQTYVLLHAEVDDFANPYQAAAAFSSARDVIAIAAFASEQMRDCATLMLPAAAFAETAGTFVNTESRWQAFKGVSKPPEEARPGWKILRVLGNVLDVAEFDYVSTQEVAAELRLELQLVKPDNRYTLPTELDLPDNEARMQRIGDVHMYRSDPLVRRAEALQEMIPAAQVRMHPVDMERLDIENGELVKAEQSDGSVQLPAQADGSVPEGCVWIQAGTSAANTLGDAFAYIDVSRV